MDPATYRKAQANQIRGLLAEYGIVIALGVRHIREMPEILENNKLKLTLRSEAIFKGSAAKNCLMGYYPHFFLGTSTMLSFKWHSR